MTPTHSHLLSGLRTEATKTLLFSQQLTMNEMREVIVKKLGHKTGASKVLCAILGKQIRGGLTCVTDCKDLARSTLDGGVLLKFCKKHCTTVERTIMVFEHFFRGNGRDRWSPTNLKTLADQMELSQDDVTILEDLPQDGMFLLNMAGWIEGAAEKIDYANHTYKLGHLSGTRQKAAIAVAEAFEEHELEGAVLLTSDSGVATLLIHDNVAGLNVWHCYSEMKQPDSSILSDERILPKTRQQDYGLYPGLPALKEGNVLGGTLVSSVFQMLSGTATGTLFQPTVRSGMIVFLWLLFRECLRKMAMTLFRKRAL